METTKELYETVLRRCKNALTKVEKETNKRLNEDPEELHDGIYRGAVKSLSYLFDVSFGSESELKYGENVVDNVKVFPEID